MGRYVDQKVPQHDQRALGIELSGNIQKISSCEDVAYEARICDFYGHGAADTSIGDVANNRQEGFASIWHIHLYYVLEQ